MTRPLHKWTSAEIAQYARDAGQITPEDMPMRLETIIYPTVEDHGTRFQDMWQAYHARPLSKVSIWSLLMIAALAGVAVAALITL